MSRPAVHLLPALAIPLALGAPSIAAAAAEPPPALIEATETASAVCIALNGTPRILAGYERSLDLNGDGREDYVTDLSHLECADAWSAFCGPSGCPVSAWLSRSDGEFDRFDLGRLTAYRIDADGPLPALVARYAASYCGESPDECTRTWRFDSNAPTEPPIDGLGPAPVVAAAVTAAEQPREQVSAPPAESEAAVPVAPVAVARSEPPARGWTLRHVPGSSPVALGMGIGEIATLAGFCLSDRPFLAVTFHERPAADTVELDFAFSQGSLAVDFGYEETAGGAFVAALADGPLAKRLGGKDAEVAVAVDGRPQGILSLAGSTKALRGALSACHGF